MMHSLIFVNKTSQKGFDMTTKTLVVGAFGILAANMAMAAISQPLTALPVESDGLFALTAACLVVGLRIVRRKRKSQSK